MSSRVIKWFHLRGLQRKSILFIVNKLLAGTKEKNFITKRKLLNKLECFEIGEGTKIVGPIACDGKLKVGKNCWIGKNLLINGNGTVCIGDNCDLGPEITFQTGGHKIGEPSRRAGGGLRFSQTVGDGCWIGGRATIINNVVIGEGSVVAGCACVVKDIQPNTIVGGVPARKIREL